VTDNEDEEKFIAEDVMIVQDRRLALNETVNLPSYGYFNTGYPFIGIDSAVTDMILPELKFYRPDISCTYSATYNPWSVCYWQDICSPDAFGDANMTFSFGSNATFVLPLSQLMINYTMSSLSSCAIAFQKITNMPYDTTTERRFYFGDIFFKSFVGVFDLQNQMLGMGKSVYAPAAV